jgi:hypothetical protein
LPIPSPQVAAQRWVAGAQAGAQKYTANVQATTKDPTALAIAQQQKLVLNFNAAVQSGHWQRKLSAVGAAGWKAAVAAKGAANFATGVTAAQTKYEQAIAPVLAIEATLQQQVDAMPKVTIADSIARAAAWINGLHQWKLSQG